MRTQYSFRGSRTIYLISALSIVLGLLTPGATPVYAAVATKGAESAPFLMEALPAWWGGADSHNALDTGVYRALPAWWPVEHTVTASEMRPLAQASVDHFEVAVPSAATAGVPFSTTIEAQAGDNSLVGITTTVSLETNGTEFISPTLAQLISGTATLDLTLTTAGFDKLVKVISGTITGTATLTVNAGMVTTLTVEPDSATVTVGQTRVFTATGTDSYGNAVEVAPQWTTNGGSVQPGPNVTTVFTAQHAPAAGKLVTATENSANDLATVGIVHGPLNSFHISPSLITTQKAGVPFPVDIDAWDVYGNLVSDYNGTAGLVDTTGSLSPSSAEFTNGVWSGNVTITRSGTGVVISVTDGAATGYSNGFTVQPADLDYIRINSGPDNATEVGAHTMDIYDTFAAWAGCYDEYDNYCGDVDATWGATGVLANGTFVPGVGISTTFTPAPVLSGTGIITAAPVGPGVGDSTGNFTIQAPWLRVSKSDGLQNDPVPAGGTLLYTIVYTNVGNAVARDVRITETYDPHVSVLSVGPPAYIDPYVWTRSTLGVGASSDIYVTVLVSDSVVPGTVLTNVVTAGGLRLAQHTFTETTVVTSTPDLTLTLNSYPDPINAGSNLFYQIHYEDQGTAPLSNIRITMTYDANLTFISSDPPPDEGNNVWVPENLKSGNINVTVAVADFMEDAHTLVTSATVKSDQTAEFVAFESTGVHAPVLALAKAATPSPVVANERLVYTLVYSNVGHADASTVVVTDAVPANTDYVSCQPAPCSKSGDIVTWQAGHLAAEASRTATMVVDVHRNLASGTVLTNTARVRVYATPAYSATTQITTTVVSSPSLGLTIDNGTTFVNAGDDLEYTLNYFNTGSGKAHSTTIVATPPSSQYVKDVHCVPASDCVWSNGKLIHYIGALAGGGSGTVRMVATVRDPLPAGASGIVASAVISTVTPGDPPAGNSAQDVDLIATRPDLIVTADYEDIMPWPGKRVTYTVQYSNEGHIATTGVVITATRPPFATFRAGASDACWQPKTAGRYRCEIGNVGYSQGGERLFVVTLPNTNFTAAMTDFDASFEIADSGVSGEDADPDNNIFEALLGVPNLVIEKVPTQPSIWQEKPGFLWARITNTGTGPACGIYNPSGCTSFALDLFINPDTPPPSYPIEEFGDCYVYVPPLAPGASASGVISFTRDPDLRFRAGYCGVQVLTEIWLKVDNWDPDADPYPADFGLVPESDEDDNVFRVVAGYDLYLPVIMSNYSVP